MRQLVKVIVETGDVKEIREYKVEQLKFKKRNRRDSERVSAEEMKALRALEEKGGKSKFED